MQIYIASSLTSTRVSSVNKEWKAFIEYFAQFQPLLVISSYTFWWNHWPHWICWSAWIGEIFLDFRVSPSYEISMQKSINEDNYIRQTWSTYQSFQKVLQFVTIKKMQSNKLYKKSNFHHNCFLSSYLVWPKNILDLEELSWNPFDTWRQYQVKARQFSCYISVDQSQINLKTNEFQRKKEQSSTKEGVHDNKCIRKY